MLTRSNSETVRQRVIRVNNKTVWRTKGITSHHFSVGVSLGSAYKEDPLGVMVTVTIGSAVGEMIQKYFGLGSPSVADFRLGASAAILGAAFGLGTIAPQELGSRIKSEFCNH